MAIDEHRGYAARYDKINYRFGLALEYKVKKAFTINTAVSYSNKDFTGTYYCHTCDMLAQGPEDINFRFLEIPMSLRYYFLPNKFKIFGEAGVNNQLFLKKEVTGKTYSLGLKLGSGVEYNFSQGTALQILFDYNKGATSLYSNSDFKVDYFGLGVSIMKKL